MRILATVPFCLLPLCFAARFAPGSPSVLATAVEEPMRIFEPRIGAWELTYAIRSGGTESTGGGVETYRFAADGKWLVVEFEGELFGEPYTSHGVTGFDPESGTYASYFFDPFLTRPSVSEGTWDAASETLVKWSDGKDFSGRECRWKQVLDYSRRDAFTLEMFAVYPDGREEASIRCSAKRRPE